MTVVNPSGRSPYVLLCDHASNRVPRALGTLGLPESELSRHIGWDIGALAMALRLSRRLDAPLVASGYSRLVIDCNRPLDAPGSIPRVSEATTVPGNAFVGAGEAAARARLFFHPYHDAVAALLDRRAAGGMPTALFSVHSFTDRYLGADRPWHVGLAYHRDPLLGPAMVAELARDAALCVGDNLPYAVDDQSDYSVPVHGERRGLPCALVEVRQDLLSTAEACVAWGDRLADALTAVVPAVLPDAHRLQETAR